MSEEKQKSNEKKDKKKRTLFQKIVNVFLYIGLGIFFLLVIAFAVSQTSTFRNWMRETAMNVANDALNGKVYIGELDGTIFTSLILKNTNVTMGKDTLLNAGKIEVRTSPLQLLLKKIYVRKIEIDDTDIKFVRDQNGELNISKLIPPSKTIDTTSSPFPFKIIVSELNIKNTNFSMKDSGLNTEVSYDSLNMHNLVVRDLNLSLSAYADIKNHDFELAIHSLSLSPNINRFTLKKLSGEFYVTNDSIRTNDLQIKTNFSDFWLNAHVNNFSIFDTTLNTDFAKAVLNLELSADRFAFSDLSAFIPATNILNGIISANIKISGSLKLLSLDLLDVNFENTHLQTGGRIENIDAGQNMHITADFYNTYLNQEDINDLLPSLQVPVFKEYGIIKFDTLSYEGKPLDFNTKVSVTTDKGSFEVGGNLNLGKEPMEYDINFRTRNFDLAPISGVPTNLTSRGSVKGFGVKPDSLNASVKFFAGGSIVNGTKMDSLRLIANAQSKKIDYRLTAIHDTTYAALDGSFDFTNTGMPSYELTGNIRNLNIAEILKDTSANTNLNFSIDASGESFDPDSINLFLSTVMYNSSVNGIKIDSTRAIVDLRKNEGGERIVNIISDLADITLTGNFTIVNAASLITYEMKIVTNAVKNKLKKLMPSFPEVDSLGSIVETIPEIEKQDRITKMDYVIEFKNFELLSLFLGGKQLELDGDIQGTLEETSDSLNFKFKGNLDYLKYWGKNDVFFLSKLNLNLALNNDLNSVSLSELNADVDLSIERIFTGNDIKNFQLGLAIKSDSAVVHFSANLEDYLIASIDSRLNFNSQGVDIKLDTLSVQYNNFKLKNKKELNIAYSPDNINFKNFELFHKNGSFAISGLLKRKGNQDLTVSIKGLTGKDISESLLGLRPENSIQSYLNFTADIKGDFESPVMIIKLSADSVTYKNKKFGSLIANLNYKNEKLNTDIRFVDSVRSFKNPKLKITGDIPINLAFSGVEERLIKDSPLNIVVSADSFKLGALGNMLPEVNKINGELSANLNIGGTFNNLQPEGKLALNNTDFVIAKNNLEYNAGLKLSITPDQIKIDSLLIKNSPGTKNGGQITGSGEAELKNLNVVSSNISLNGQLKVLGEESRSASPSVYGDLVIATQGNIEFKLDANGTTISVPVVVKEADLTFPQTESAYQNSSNDFIYVFPEDTNQVQKGQADFQRLVDLSHKHNQSQQNGSSSNVAFDYKIDVHVEKEAKITFVLSKELDQNLTAILKGDFHYERINGRTDASGELNLLNGSTLEFLKTFDADGTIRFENQLDNPYLDITATYIDYYSPAGDSVSNNEVKVAVKINIKGYLKDLGKNLVQGQNNIEVYYGANNIENNNPDPTKSASDAVLFILAGRFTEGATQQDRNAAASTAASLAGSVVGGFLNKQFGDIVRRVELRQVGATTRFNLVGKAGDINYSIGGSTEVFQDISQANIKLEYPITNKLLIRLERKQSVTESNTNINEMINELGLKYKFEF